MLVLQFVTEQKKLPKNNKQTILKVDLDLSLTAQVINYDKIATQSNDLRQLGYDTHMIFVNTSLDVALERNAKRSRSVPESIVIKSWKEVQANIGKFNNHFKSEYDYCR